MKKVEKKRVPIGGLEHPNKESYPVFFLFLLTQKLEEVNYPSDSNGIYNLLSKFNYSLNWVTAVVSWLLPLL